MKCPKCGFEQPASPECLQCGLIFERYRSDKERQEVVEIELARKKAAEPDPFERPIRPQLRIVRTGAGVVGAVMGGWLFFAGQSLELSPLHVFALIGYGCVSLFWILSAPIRVSIKQFVIEMLIFIVATLGLRIALPEAFDLGTLTNRQEAEFNVGLNEQKFTTQIDGLTFVRLADKLSTYARGVLDDPTDGPRAEQWFEEAQRLRELFRGLDSEERKGTERVYKGVVALEGALETALGEEAPASAMEDAFIALESLEKLVLEAPGQ